MMKWLVLLLLLLAAYWAGDKLGTARANAKADSLTVVAEQTHRAVDSLKRVEAALRERYTVDTVVLTRWRTRWDSLKVTDSVPVEVLVYVADSTIRACTLALGTCEARVAAATERGDSAESEAATWQATAAQWKRVARGPLLRPALEGTLRTSDWSPQAAAEVTVGRGAFKLLGRIEAAEGPETCAFVPQTETYACRRDWETTGLVGVRWAF